MNFLKPTPESCLSVLKRLALHFPRSKQVAILDLLAEDYAKACRDMTQGEFQDAADKVLETSKYFPTIAQIRGAREAARAEQLRAEYRAYEDQADEDWTEEKRERNRRNAKELIQALREGRRPNFFQ